MKNSRVYRFSALALILCGAFYLCSLAIDVAAKLGDPKLSTWLLGGKLPQLYRIWGLALCLGLGKLVAGILCRKYPGTRIAWGAAIAAAAMCAADLYLLCFGSSSSTFPENWGFLASVAVLCCLENYQDNTVMSYRSMGIAMILCTAMCIFFTALVVSSYQNYLQSNLDALMGLADSDTLSGFQGSVMEMIFRVVVFVAPGTIFQLLAGIQALRKGNRLSRHSMWMVLAAAVFSWVGAYLLRGQEPLSSLLYLGLFLDLLCMGLEYLSVRYANTQGQA